MDKSYLVPRKWSVELAPKQLSLHKLPIWVCLRKIPLAFYHREGISHIASGVGHPLYMDKATANGTKLDYAKACIEIDAPVNLPEKLRLEIEDNCAVEIEVEVPWLPEKCAKCGVFGHTCKQEQRTPVHEIPRGVKLKTVDREEPLIPPMQDEDVGSVPAPACTHTELDQGRESKHHSDSESEMLETLINRRLANRKRIEVRGMGT